MTAAPYRRVGLGTRAVAAERRDDGTILLRSREALGAYPAKITDRLVAAARQHPDRVFVAARAGAGWRRVTYAEALDAVERIGQGLLDRGLTAERPVAILSPGSIEHALLALACQHVGIPYAPVTPAYSLLDPTLAKLRHVLGLLRPGLVFVQDGAEYARALDALDPGTEIVAARAPPAGRAATPFSVLARTAPGAAMQAASASVSPDTVAKILFTSGSTGFPKGVINTQRMVCSNQQMFLQALPLIAERPPVVLSWLPWHHTSGGNQILGLVVYNAGTLHIDEGKPVAGAMETTVANLREIAPTMYFTVPRGYAELIPFLRADAALRARFFSQLAMLYYSGASLPDAVVAEIDRIAVESCGERIPMLCGYGATEVAPLALIVNWHAERSGLAGLPVPGMELKLVPYGGKYEARVRGPSATPGYWRQPELTRALRDEEGFLRLGDALSFVDPDDIGEGLAFDGRISEDFKLSTGTWVNVDALRARLIAEVGTVVQDVVIAGEGRDQVAALIFPDRAACAALCGTSPDDPELPAHPRLRAHVQAVIDRLAAAGTGSSTFVARAVLLRERPSATAGEVTDKGSINQRAVLAVRTDVVDMLFSLSPPSSVLRAGQGGLQPGS